MVELGDEGFADTSGSWGVLVVDMQLGLGGLGMGFCRTDDCDVDFGHFEVFMGFNCCLQLLVDVEKRVGGAMRGDFWSRGANAGLVKPAEHAIFRGTINTLLRSKFN